MFSSGLLTLCGMCSTRKLSAAGLIALTAITSGCGASGRASPASPASPATTTLPATRPASNGATSASSSTPGGPGALSAEAQSAATGDIPDNQVFLVFRDRGARYSIKYPEGWTEQGNGGNVTFRDKNNLVHIVVGRGPAPTVSSVATQLRALERRTPSLGFTAPRLLTISATRVVKARYTTESAPNNVTGKRVKLIVDRYEMGRNGRVALVDLGTPVGVDNVDAYRMMIESFTWR